MPDAFEFMDRRELTTVLTDYSSSTLLSAHDVQRIFSISEPINQSANQLNYATPELSLARHCLRIRLVTSTSVLPGELVLQQPTQGSASLLHLPASSESAVPAIR